MAGKRVRLPKETYQYLKGKNEANISRIAAGMKGQWNLSKLHRNIISEALLESQHHLCAYCESRIWRPNSKNTRNNFHIEHYMERQDAFEKTYEYSNFLGSCEGGRFRDHENEMNVERNIRTDSITCGHAKTQANGYGTPIDYTKLLDPLSYSYSKYFEYDGVKLIPHKARLKQAQSRAAYTIDRLNLNADRLLLARQAIKNIINKDILKYKQNAAVKRYITNLLKEQEFYPPFRSFIEFQFGWIIN